MEKASARFANVIEQGEAIGWFTVNLCDGWDSRDSRRWVHAFFAALWDHRKTWENRTSGFLFAQLM